MTDKRRNIVRIFKRFAVVISVLALIAAGTGCADGGKESSGKAILWSAPSTVKYMLDDKPVTTYGTDMHISLAANEKESAQFIVTPSFNVKSYNISFGDLKDGKGNVIGKENISLYVEKYINVSIATSTFRTGYYPDALVPYGSVKEAKEDRIKAGQNQAFLFTVSAPADAKAGEYSSDVVLTLNGKTYKVKLNVTVYGFAISTESHSRTSFFLWYDQFMYQCDNVTDELIDNYIDFMLDYRVNTSIGRMGNLSEAESLAKYIEFAKDERVNTIDLPFEYVTETSVSGKSYTSFDYDGLKEFLKKIIRASSNEENLVKKFKLSFNALDEPKTGQYENVCFVHQRFTQLKKELAADASLFPIGVKDEVKNSLLDIPNACTTNYKETLDKNINGNDYGVDAWCGTYDWYDSATNRYRLGLATEQGDGSWWYGCIQPTHPYPTYHIDDNLLSARALNWMMMDYGIEGNHYWAVNIWSVYEGFYTWRDVWTESLAFPGAVGDGYLIYPGTRYGLNTAIASLRLEAIRDGLEDYEYLYMLKGLSEALAEKYDVFDYDFNKNISLLYDLIFQGTIIHNDLDAFAAARETIAQMILAAQKGILTTFERAPLTGKLTARVYAGENVSDVKVNEKDCVRSVSGEGSLYQTSFFPDNYAKISCDADGNKFSATLYVGGMSAVVNAFETANSIENLIFTDESEFDGINDTVGELSSEFCKNKSALKLICRAGEEKSYRNGVTFTEKSGLPTDAEKYGALTFWVYNPNDVAIDVVASLKNATSSVRLVTAVAAPGKWTEVTLQFVNLGKFDMTSLKELTVSFGLMNAAEVENYTVYLDNVSMIVRGVV